MQTTLPAQPWLRGVVVQRDKHAIRDRGEEDLPGDLRAWFAGQRAPGGRSRRGAKWS